MPVYVENPKTWKVNKTVLAPRSWKTDPYQSFNFIVVLGMIMVTALMIISGFAPLAMIILSPIQAVLGYTQAYPLLTEGKSHYRFKIPTKNDAWSNNMYHDWLQTLKGASETVRELGAFIGTQEAEEYSFDQISSAYREIYNTLWKMGQRTERMKPFLTAPTNAIRDIVEEEHTILKREAEQITQIFEGCFNVSIRAASFTHADKDQLGDFVKELGILCDSMDELREINQYVLPSSTKETKADYGVSDGWGDVREAQKRAARG